MIDNVKIDYLGWSGFQIEKNSGPKIFVDPPKGTDFPDEQIIILITHGHPEHLGGTLEFIRESSTNKEATIITSRPLCIFLKKRCAKPNVEFIIAQPKQTISLSPVYQFTPFVWTHMPLLPPGISAACRHIWQIIKGYKHVWKILKTILRGPNQVGDMLGYIVKLHDQNIIIYGEGLHRKCKTKDVAIIGALAPKSTIVAACEPEDFYELPDLIYASEAIQAIIYEPHRPWRDQFKLPHIDLMALQKKVADMGIHARIAL